MELAQQAAVLGCAAPAEDAKKLSSLHPQDRSLPSSLTASGIEDVQLPTSSSKIGYQRGQTPSAPHHIDQLR